MEHRDGSGKKEFIQKKLKTKSQMDSDMYLPLELSAIKAI